jgi:hypothetical protein
MLGHLVSNAGHSTPDERPPMPQWLKRLFAFLTGWKF